MRVAGGIALGHRVEWRPRLGGYSEDEDFSLHF